MTEVLIVVAIIGILAAVAIPNVIAYRRSLKLTELDDNARTIYLAAQSNLAALRSAAGDTLTLGEDVGRKAASVPSDAVSGLDGLKYVSTNEAATDPNWLVLPGSVDPALREEGSYYLVEFDPASGVIYGVFYTEAGDGKPLTKGNYEKLCESACRVREGRDAFAKASDGFFVGYYGADGALDLSRPENQQLPTPKLKLTNAEELALELTGTMDPDSAVDPGKVFYAVSLSDGVHAKTLVEKGKFNDGATNTVVLDTLKGGYNRDPDSPAYGGWSAGRSFVDWDTGVTPGADVTVTVTAWYQPDSGEGMAALPQSASVSTNSLFGQRSESGETVQVGYGRHLQNLGLTGLDSAITAAVQVREIDFAKTTPANDKDMRQHWAETYGDKSFVPIKNAALNRFDGQGRAIKNLNATAQGGKNAGLFETLEAATVEAVKLVDAKASAPGQSAGALAGVAGNNTQVKDCQVYLTAQSGVYSAATRISGTNAGGLIGYAQGCVIEDSFASTVARGTQNTGGLVGRSGNVSIKTSYAAGRLSGPRVGGLVGGGSGVSMTDCYAAGLLVPDANGEAAGLCAMEVNSAMRCYAAADYATAEGTSYAIVGAVPGGGCSSVYYLAKSGVNDVSTVAGVDRVASSDQMTKDAGGVLSGFYAFKTSAAKTYPYNHVTRTQEEGPLKAPYPYPALGDLPHYGDWLEATAPTVTSLVAYYEKNEIARNEWESDTSYEFFCYVNGEAKSSLSDRTRAIPAEGYVFLSREKLATQWTGVGEATYLQVNLSGLDTASGVELLATPLYDSFALTEDLVPTSEWGTDVAYYAYVLPRAGLEQVRPATGNSCTKLDITPVTKDWSGSVTETKPTTTAWINPLFGKAAYNGKEPGSSKVFAVRSLRHLNNISGFYGGQTYVQELDIDGGVYKDNTGFNASGNATVAGMELRVSYDNGATWVPYNRTDWLPGNRRVLFDPIVETDADETVGSFNSTYDGSGRTISHLMIGSRLMKDEKTGKEYDYAGLFARSISGTVRNVNIDSCHVVGVTGKDANGSGVLMGRLSSVVENCTVKNSTVTAEGTKAGGHVGGLVGYVNDGGAIAGCSVENTAVTGGSFSYNAGGFAGYIYKQTAATAVRDCAVKNVQVTNGYSKAGATSVEKRGAIGGFAGCMKDNEGAVERCLVIGTGTLNISGASPYSGGFVGLMNSKDAGVIRDCGVRLEGKAKNTYDQQAVSGGQNVGGFAGMLGGGSIQSSYAAVKVDGGISGGFVGSLEGGAIANCYAGGHTKSGKYTAAMSNVTGTARAGGLVGLWEGGEVTACYTTCAVSGPNEGAADVFANQQPATLNSPVSGCYALGDAFVAGTKMGSLTKTTVAVSMTKLANDQRTETHAYDSSLSVYPYAPAKYADGALVPHYGDWPEEQAGGYNFEWQPVPDKVPDADMDYVEDISAQWKGEELTLTFETKGTALSDLFTINGGTFTITTDLGYVRALDVTKVDGGPTVCVSDGMGGEWYIRPVTIGYTTVNGSQVSIWQYTFTVPSSRVPPYKESIGVGGFMQGEMLDGIKNEAPDATENKPTRPFLPGDSVVINGSFDDWTGYPHQVLAYTGTGAAAKTAIGAAFGDDTTIYIHVKNEYTTVAANYNGTLGDTSIFKGIDIVAEGDPEWGWSENRLGSIMNLLVQPYVGPGIYKWERVSGGETTVLGEVYMTVDPETGVQEMEMVMYLDRIAGQAVADQIDGLIVKFTSIGGSTLTIRRDLSEKNQ